MIVISRVNLILIETSEMGMLSNPWYAYVFDVYLDKA